MSDPDPDDPGDPQLRGLRAVWLALPDEEPPQRGIAELMAAARVKAEVMARPPWWQRVLDVARRPPVLALATVVVLIGGAVLVGKHEDTIETPSPSAREPAGAAPQAGSAAMPVAPSAQPQLAAPALAAPARDSAERPEPVTEPAKDDRRLKPPPAKYKSPKFAPPSEVRDLGKAEQAKAAPPTVALPAPTAGETIEVEQGAAAADPDQPRPTSTARGAAAPAHTPAPTPEAPPPPQQAVPQLDQLLAQCRSAAARGDCAGARALAAQISQRDADYYRKHVAADAALSGCLR